MADFQVPDPILNSPYEEPALHWWIEDGSPPQQREGRRPAMYFYRDPKTRAEHQGRQGGEPPLCNGTVVPRPRHGDTAHANPAAAPP